MKKVYLIRLQLFFLLIFTLFILTGCNDKKAKTNENYNTTRTSVETDNVAAKAEAATEDITRVTDMAALDSSLEQEIGIFTTTIYTKTNDRQHNLELTSSKLNGVIVKAGAEFSFNATIPVANPENGYVKAEIFDHKGNKKQGYGGRNLPSK